MSEWNAGKTHMPHRKEQRNTLRFQGLVDFNPADAGLTDQIGIFLYRENNVHSHVSTNINTGHTVNFYDLVHVRHVHANTTCGMLAQ